MSEKSVQIGSGKEKKKQMEYLYFMRENTVPIIEADFDFGVGLLMAMIDAKRDRSSVYLLDSSNSTARVQQTHEREKGRTGSRTI